MLDYMLTEKEKTYSDKDIVLLTNYMNNMKRTCKRRGSFRENMNYSNTDIYNHKETVEMLEHTMKKDVQENLATT